MPAWKVLLIMLLGTICFCLALATIIVPLTMVVDNSRWLWLAGLLFGTIVMGTLLAMFLKNADSKFK